jgi:radical SAM superfamily enzyme
LAGSENELCVESRDFFCDRRIGIETTSLLNVDISCEDIVETKNKIEITLTGTIDNQQGKRAGFTLYFFMWWNRHAPVLNKGKEFVRSQSDTLNIHFEEKPKQLSDAVFDLLLYRRNPSFQRDVLGNGRGFLFIGSDQG